MKTLGLVAAMFLGLAGLPAAASAQGWRGGGGGHVAAHGGFGGHAVHGGVGVGVRGGGWGVGVRGPAVHVGVGVRPVAPVRAHVWVPGYWGWRGGTRLWIGGGYYAPPYDGWIWVAPQWVWNGYQWVWQDGRWAPPM